MCWSLEYQVQYISRHYRRPYYWYLYYCLVHLLGVLLHYSHDVHFAELPTSRHRTRTSRCQALQTL